MSDTLHVEPYLLNFQRAPFKMRYPVVDTPMAFDFEYTCVEKRFQGMKALFLTSDHDWCEIHDWIADPEIKPSASKFRGSQIEISSELWDHASFGVMLEAHMSRFFQHEESRQRLLSTGDKFLVEHRKDPVWGDNLDGSGRNLCGKSLIIVRDMVRNYFT